MAFNMGAFLGGAATGLVERIEDDERKAEKKADRDDQRAYTKSEEARLYKRGIRDTKQAKTNALAGFLTSLNYNPDTVAKIMKTGNLSAQYWAEQGQLANQKGIDPNILISFSANGELNEAAKANFEEVVGAADENEISASEPAGMGEISSGAEAGASGNVTLADGFTVNVEAMARLHAPKDKDEKTYGAALAVLSQKMLRKPDDPLMDSWKAEQTKLLEDLGAYEKAKRGKGEKGDAFGLGTISSQVNEIRGGAVKPLGMSIGLKGELLGLNDGNRHLAYIADLNVANQLKGRNTEIQSATMDFAIAGIQGAALDNLTDYALNIYNTKRDTVIDGGTIGDAFDKNMREGAYKVGSVIYMNDGMLLMYTGITDFTTGQKFIVLNEGMSTQ